MCRNIGHSVKSTNCSVLFAVWLNKVLLTVWLVDWLKPVYLLQVVYFNTYLADPRRPQLPEHPTTRMIMQAKEAPLSVPSGFHGPPPGMMGYRPPPVVYPGLYLTVYSCMYCVSGYCSHELCWEHCRFAACRVFTGPDVVIFKIRSFSIMESHGIRPTPWKIMWKVMENAQLCREILTPIKPDKNTWRKILIWSVT